MSKARDLRTHPENNINVYDLFSLLVPEKKSKYVETLFRLMKKTTNLDEYAADVRKGMVEKYGMSLEIENVSSLSVIFYNVLLSGFFESEDLVTFRKFCDYNERGIIKQNDLTKYKDLSEIKSAVDVASLIAEKKELEKQVEVIFESDEWLLLKPLTFLASKKYGANTKWCTTTENNDSYFIKYASNGVLIYCLNKLTGYKVATYRSLKPEEPEFSFWNSKDVRIDSLETELTTELRSLIDEVSKSKTATTNFKLWEKKNSKSLVKTMFGMEKKEIKKLSISDELVERPIESEILGSDYVSEAVLNESLTNEEAPYDQIEVTRQRVGEYGLTERVLEEFIQNQSSHIDDGPQESQDSNV